MKPPQYSKKKDQLAERLKCSKYTEEWWITMSKQVLATAKMMDVLLKKFHEETHMEAAAIMSSVERYAIGPKMQSGADVVVRRCQTCCGNNPEIQRKPPAGKTLAALSEEVAQVREATLENRAAIDYLLLRPNPGCEEFKGMCCCNLSVENCLKD
ncbi:endogenous retrovirus group k member 18 pol [Limosa lapponica baueri]|uniref:Endogenous retrovirus group k member 18 pol n=1 Tax=Limosa lapponica baueri TaxID=1758121 RepID=A0A2I0TRN4_LIMLA|nr:endogenous retrovirus group k member 18 pol [Limosa lapponica baueri]